MLKNGTALGKSNRKRNGPSLRRPPNAPATTSPAFSSITILPTACLTQPRSPSPLPCTILPTRRSSLSSARGPPRSPGLEIVSAGRGPDRAICIGWNRASVYSLAGEIENVARENQKKRVETEWETAMQDHQQFANAESDSAPPLSPAAAERVVPTPAALQLTCGSFILHCQAVADKRAEHPDSDITKLALDIADIPAVNVEMVRASVDLGVFSGTALLSFSQDIVEWFVKRYDKTAVDAADQATIFATSRDRSGKRKAEAYPEEEQQRPKKQPKVQEPKPGRIFLQMRGEANGKICPDIQHGYLDFLDGAWTKFKGVFDIPGVGNDIEVEGFRVAREAAVDPPPWNAYWPYTLHPAVSAKFRYS